MGPVLTEARMVHRLGSESKQSQLACNTCNVVATSEGQLASHLEGKKHQRFLAMAQLEDGATIERNHSSNLEEDLHCNLCDVTAPSAHHREYHLRCAILRAATPRQSVAEGLLAAIELWQFRLVSREAT